MTTFDLAEVRDFTGAQDARLNRCDNGEGMECANLDDTLRQYATVCCEFRSAVRKWAQAVFAGRVAFDPEVERHFLDHGHELYFRAIETLASGQDAEEECYVLDGGAALRSALWQLHQLLSRWITPARAVGPSARQSLNLSPAAATEVRRKIESLPALPPDWMPADPRQRRQLKKLQRRTG